MEKLNYQLVTYVYEKSEEIGKPKEPSVIKFLLVYNLIRKYLKLENVLSVKEISIKKFFICFKKISSFLIEIMKPSI